MKKIFLAALAAIVGIAPVASEAHVTGMRHKHKVRIYRGTKASHDYKRAQKEPQVAPAATQETPAPAAK